MTHEQLAAMKQALEALEVYWGKAEHRRTKEDDCKAQETITTLRTAIEQAETAQGQEPVAWATAVGSYAHISWGKDRPDYPIRYEVPLYTTPPAAQRQWVGLTDEEANELWESTDDRDSWELIMRVQKKLREKNGGLA